MAVDRHDRGRESILVVDSRQLHPIRTVLSAGPLLKVQHVPAAVDHNVHRDTLKLGPHILRDQVRDRRPGSENIRQLCPAWKTRDSL